MYFAPSQTKFMGGKTSHLESWSYIFEVESVPWSEVSFLKDTSINRILYLALLMNLVDCFKWHFYLCMFHMWGRFLGAVSCILRENKWRVIFSPKGKNSCSMFGWRGRNSPDKLEWRQGPWGVCIPVKGCVSNSCNSQLLRCALPWHKDQQCIIVRMSCWL